MRLCSALYYSSRAQVLANCPDAAKVVKCEGGWMAFDSMDQYRTWKAQR
jgi:hypothetical protein